MDPFYEEYVVWEGNQDILFVLVTKAIYGLLVSAMLLYRKTISAGTGSRSTYMIHA
jgi:hypothetical protein